MNTLPEPIKKRFVKIIHEDKRVPVIHLPSEKWDRILRDPGILVQYAPDETKPWDVKTLNKTKVVFAEYDEEYTRKANVQIHDLYHNKITDSVVKIRKGELPPNNVDFIKVNSN